jgi:hypothetical protein
LLQWRWLDYSSVSVTPPVQPAGEVRVTEYARRAARRWYVIVVAVVAAVLLVFLHGVSAATKQSAATASVYLGQPFGPGGSSVLANTPLSNPTISITYVTAPQQINAAAKAAGIDHRNLRSHVSVLSSGGGGGGTGAKAATGGGGAPTITITVEGPWTKQKVEVATNTLAQQLIAFANRYTTLKAKLINHRIAIEQAQIKTFTEAEQQAQKNIKAIDNSSARPLDKVAAESPFVSDLETAASQIASLTDSLTNDEVSLVAAHDIESASFISRATGHGVSAATRRHSLIIAAIIGLIVGIGLALAWESLRMRPRPGRA